MFSLIIFHNNRGQKFILPMFSELFNFLVLFILYSFLNNKRNDNSLSFYHLSYYAYFHERVYSLRKLIIIIIDTNVYNNSTRMTRLIIFIDID